MFAGLKQAGSKPVSRTNDLDSSGITFRPGQMRGLKRKMASSPGDNKGSYRGH